MYKIYYGKETESFDSVEEVMNRMKVINEEKVYVSQFVSIEYENHGSLEFALGMGDESVLLYVPNEESEDVLISCNDLITRAKSEDVEIADISGEVEIFTTANLVYFYEVLVVLEAFLKGEDFIHFIDWYAY